MSTQLPPVPESCTQCPHFDHFHGACTHSLRLTIMRELRGECRVCPLFSEIRAEAMRDLESRLN